MVQQSNAFGNAATEKHSAHQAPSWASKILAADSAYREESDGGALSWAASGRFLNYVSEGVSEWAGIPMPLTGEKLVVEARYPHADALAKLGVAERSGSPTEEDEDEDTKGATVRNVFYSHKWRCDIIIWQEADGKLEWGKLPAVHHFTQDIQTLGCSDAWSLETEFTALETLRGLVSHHQMRQYLLTGMFIESSKRSGLKYVFRRLKPTVALTERGNHVDEKNMRILAALCLHPLAYYKGSWAGALCPTDDVIAHLCLMRGDEKLFWRRASQHPAHRPEAGL